MSARTQAGAQNNQQDESPFRKFIAVAQQILFIYVVTHFASKLFAPKTAPTESPDAIPGRGTGPDLVDPFSLPPAYADLAWPLGIPVSLHFHLSTSGQAFALNPEDVNLPHFVWHEITFGDWSEVRSVDYPVHLPESVQHNGSLWAHIFLTKDNVDPDPSSAAYREESVHHVRKLLTRFLPRPKFRKERKLLRDKNDMAVVDDEPEVADTIVSYWHQNLTLALVSDTTSIQYVLPPAIAEHVDLVPGKRDETGARGYYNPIIFSNEFWHLRSQYIEINATTPSVPLRVVFQPMSYFKFQMFASLTFGFQEAIKKQGSGSASEFDEVKRMLVETNPWFLGLTGVVSVLHVVFEMLAFKSDVSHWRKKNELTGVSIRTIITNVFVQLVILLYLIDNNTDTSWMILMGSGMGVLIEAWKITKAVDIKIVTSEPGSMLPRKIIFADKHVLSEDEKKTQEYDKLAFRYVSYVALPALAIYAVYSLVYETHRGWYSFTISTLTSFVYMFGFAQLIPQLIINYKLKSVAHMPMNAMVYKTLSTVIDDLFAFIIKMPILHRLACFRDDVVFLIFLYQASVSLHRVIY
ncbi:cleft lip and palate transmembrane 1 [Russula aff. rugulosa BPL654]|nr:cleft lip and palate transmembrane 1 [Russula aff. rugulosa BPL654]